jgi:hypothetical protein
MPEQARGSKWNADPLTKLILEAAMCQTNFLPGAISVIFWVAAVVVCVAIGEENTSSVERSIVKEVV